ncbi:MAG: cysteine peptidase family C39 domain-containing protein [Coriobacteriia bacterium]|nr:cysteine peptidase family C39 domain-containing protein [Coriobacteriia bacterium]
MNKPRDKGVARVPLVMQLKNLDCGAACLAMVLAYYSKWVTLEQLRSECGVSRDGVKATNIVKTARFHDLEADGYKGEIDALLEEATYPCIIHWGFNHFVVLKGFRHGKAYINDPARGIVKVDMDEFSKMFTGIVLVMKPNENFEPSGKRKSVLRFVAKRLKGSSTAIIISFLISVITGLLNLINPAFSRVFLDKLLTHENPEWVGMFIAALFIFSLLQIIVDVVRTIYELKINGKLTVVGYTTFMWKLFNLPLDYFSQVSSGDLKTRQSLNASVSDTLIKIIAPLLVNFIMMIFYFVVMIKFSWSLTIIGLSCIFINMLVSRYIGYKRLNISRVSSRDSANLMNTGIAGIEMIDTIKAAGAENGYFTKWSSLQALVNKQKVSFIKVSEYLGMIPKLTNMIANDLILIFGVFLVIQGEFTIGMVMQFQAYLGMFLEPSESLISAGQSLQEMRMQMERIEDVMDYPDEQFFAKDDMSTNVMHNKLSGEVKVNNLFFGYSKLAEPVIKDFNLKLDVGKSVAIVGKTGCGKSTISKLLSGLYSPWDGEIIYDDKPINTIQKIVFNTSVGIVDQDIIMFEDTIMNNIKMWDDSITEADVIQAAKDAQIHDDIIQFSGGYKYIVKENGKNLSGGQRQRLEIARVLASNPSIIIMDEATSALDAKTEHNVIKAIEKRGITCIVVAHRLSAIRSCDQIIVLSKGEIVQTGTHKELYKNCKQYKDLVTSE